MKEPKTPGAVHRTGADYATAVGPQVEVADSLMVLDARYACWSREAAWTSLVARPVVSPFGKLLA
jgi:hypothetical protein